MHRPATMTPMAKIRSARRCDRQPLAHRQLARCVAVIAGLPSVAMGIDVACNFRAVAALAFAVPIVTAHHLGVESHGGEGG
jgi:hypothetical protein